MWWMAMRDDARDPVPEGMVYVPAPMPYWMRLTSYGIGMHGGLIPEPGKPASHGCIRLPKEFVPKLFDSVDVGTPVTITNAPSKRSQFMSGPVLAQEPVRREVAPAPRKPAEKQPGDFHLVRLLTTTFVDWARSRPDVT